MKRFIPKLTAALTLACSIAGAAFADVVTIPANVQTPEGALAYTTALDEAVGRVCRKETGPPLGVAYFSYKACLKDTRADVAAKDPTGLYAARFLNQPSSLALAAK